MQYFENPLAEEMYFRRDGTPYKNIIEWAKDFEDFKLRRVALTPLWWGGRVSTVWLGMNHRFGLGRPLIFETVVFGPRSLKDLDTNRYSTEEEATAGHNLMVKRWQLPLWPLLKNAYCDLRWAIENNTWLQR